MNLLENQLDSKKDQILLNTILTRFNYYSIIFNVKDETFIDR